MIAQCMNIVGYIHSSDEGYLAKDITPKINGVLVCIFLCTWAKSLLSYIFRSKMQEHS